jgi:hypothetical protein
MAYTTIDKSDNQFSVVKYTGNGASDRAVTSGFATDFVWIKNRDTSDDNVIFDKIRTGTKYVYTNANQAESTYSGLDLTFESTGVDVGSYTTINNNGSNLISYHFKAGTTSGLSGGTITPSSYSINTTSKFGIYKYTGNNTSGATISHGLGAVPNLIFVKRLDTTGSWQVLGNGDSQPGANYYGILNSTDGFASNSNRWNNTAPTTSLFSLGNSAEVNASGGTYVAYVWCNVTGYFKSGIYQGNNNANGPFVYTGGKPKFILIRPNIAGKNWFMYDHKRNGMNSGTDAYTNKTLWASSANSEASVGNYKIDILSNGFKIIETGTDTNGLGNSYQYWCWMQSLVGSNNVPCTAR